MLDIQLKNQLKTYLQNLKSPVELAVFLDDSAKAKEVDQLATEIAQLSDKISLVEQENTGHERTPSLIIQSSAKGTKIRFAGVPLGHGIYFPGISTFTYWRSPN